MKHIQRPQSALPASLLFLLIIALQSVAVAGQSPTARPKVEALLTQGQDVYNSGRLDEASKLFQTARELAVSLADKVGEGTALRRIGNVALDKGQTQEAQADYEHARQLYQQAGDKVGEAYIVYSFGRLQLITGHSQEGLKLLQQALMQFRQTGTTAGEALALKMIGDCYTTIAGSDQKSLDYYLQALPLFHQLGDKRFEAITLSNMAVISVRVGKPEKALEYRRQSLPIWRQLGSRSNEGGTLFALGIVSLSAGHASEAVEYDLQAMQIYHELGNTYDEANVQNSIGITYRDLGEPQKALEHLLQAVQGYHKTGKAVEETRSLANIGVVYLDSGQPLKALEYCQQVLPIFRKTGNKSGEAGTLSNIGECYLAMGHQPKAMEYYRLSLPLRREEGDKVGEALSLNNIGGLYGKTGQPKMAVDYLNRALTISRQVGDRFGEARALDSIARVFAQIGQQHQAMEYYRRALDMRRGMGERLYQVRTLTSMGQLSAARNDLPDAAKYFDEAIGLAERYRANLGGFGETKTDYLQSQLPLYYGAMKVQLQLHHPERAFALAQQTKGRNLLDLMALGRVDLSHKLSQDETKQLQDLRFRADSLNQQMVKEGVDNEVGAKLRYAALQTQLKEVESQIQTLNDALYARYPGLAQKRVAKTVTLSEVASFLPPDTAILDYVFTSKDEVRLFVVTITKGKPALQSFPIGASADSLASRTAELRAACSDPRKQYRALTSAMYRLLVYPAERAIVGKKRLVICPDGPLWDVPFQALLLLTGTARSGFLAQRYEIAYAYSASGAQAALTARKNLKKPERTLLAMANPDFGSSKRFGDLDDLPGQRPFDAPSRPFDAPSRPFEAPSRPIDVASRTVDVPTRAFDSISRGGRISPLPGTQREADALKRDFPDADIYTGAEAQESIAKRDAGKYRYLHFATHGFFNDASPLLSSIVLARPEAGSKEDGFLTAREIFDMDLAAEMVVLSACNTARGVQRSGDGIIGLTWALFVAGCPTQVVSQWSVDDACTATLMESFYANLTRKKMAKGAALRQASLALMNDKKHSHPYYWAPFVLMGDWR